MYWFRRPVPKPKRGVLIECVVRSQRVVPNTLWLPPIDKNHKIFTQVANVNGKPVGGQRVKLIAAFGLGLAILVVNLRSVYFVVESALL